VTARHLNAVFSSPAPGLQAEYGRWYDEEHLGDCVRGIDGYAAGRRFAIDRALSGGAVPAWSHVALYELDADLPDVFASVEEFKRRGDYERPGGRVAPGLETWVYSLRTDGGDARDAPLACSVEHRLCLCFSRAWHDWHQDRLLARVAPGLPGFAGGWRYVRSAQQRLGVSPPWELLTVVELGPDGVHELVRDRSGAALGADLATWVLAPVSPVVTRPGGER
jgi:hypothetical protein